MHRTCYLLLATAIFLCGMAHLCAAAPVGDPSAYWHAAAGHWPDGTLTEGESTQEMRARFTRLLTHVLAGAWQPGDTPLPYYQGWGFYLTRENAGYRLRIREAMLPVYEGSPVLSDGLVLQVDDVQGKIHAPTTRTEMVALLGKFLAASRLAWPDDPHYRQPEFQYADGLSLYTLPNGLFAWADGTTLRIVHVEEPAHRVPEVVHPTAATLYPARDGSLNYPLPVAMRNPWLMLAAQGWPGDKTPTGKAANGEWEHFRMWALSTVRREWLPTSFTQTSPYCQGVGFVTQRTNADYRVRVREVSINYPPEAKAMVLAVEPLKGKIAVPGDEAAMMALLWTFVHPAVLAMPPLEQYSPTLTAYAGGVHFARYRTEDPSAGIPVDLFAWTDGRILLIALHEDLAGDCPTCGF